MAVLPRQLVSPYANSAGGTDLGGLAVGRAEESTGDGNTDEAPDFGKEDQEGPVDVVPTNKAAPDLITQPALASVDALSFNSAGNSLVLSTSFEGASTFAGTGPGPAGRAGGRSSAPEGQSRWKWHASGHLCRAATDRGELTSQSKQVAMAIAAACSGDLRISGTSPIMIRFRIQRLHVGATCRQ